MKAIILAAGEGTRLRPLTHDIPKSLVQVGWKTLLEYNMQSLVSYVDEFIIVVKYKKEKVAEAFWESYEWVPIRYHKQGHEKGTGAAIKWINTSGDIIIAYSDAIIMQADVDAVMKCSHFAVLGKKVKNPEKYGIFQISSDGYIEKIVEKPLSFVGNMANFWFFKVDDSLLEIIKDIKLSPRGEIEITDAINVFVKTKKMQCIKLKNDIVDITSLQDLEEANKQLLPAPLFWKIQYLESIGDLELYLGISEKSIHEIVAYSESLEDTRLQENTSDKKRFESKERMLDWYQDAGRYVFSLVSKSGDIAGIVWYRPSLPPIITEERNSQEVQKLIENKDVIHTGWIRIYPDFRGKWLAGPLLSLSEKYYKMIFQTGIICVDIESTNIPSQKTFERVGYIHIGYGENQKTIQNETHKRMVYIK
jgi:dTDP-glucose pyrophosphorylase